MTEKSDGRDARDQHWFSPGPKRILSLDGGGVRGAVAVAFLERIEQILSDHHREQTSDSFRLGDWFDLIGGTSTGAVIAGALSLGHRVAQLKNFYLEHAPAVFAPRWQLMGLRPKFDAQALRTEIVNVVGDRTLDTPDLRTGFCVVAKRIDTGSPWIVANNPRAPYWEDKSGPDGYLGNKHYRLAELVRASTAAPYYFDPEQIVIAQGGPRGTFVDGGVSPHNNPSLILFLMTILKAYRIGWKTGPENLTIISIGTGRQRMRVAAEELGIASNIRLPIEALLSVMNDSQELVLTLMQYLGESVTEPWWINSEIERLEGEQPHSGKQFRFIRYDIQLEQDWIAEHLGKKLAERDVLQLREMDNPDNIKRLYDLAAIAAERQVRPEHLIDEKSRARRPSVVTAP